MALHQRRKGETVAAERKRVGKGSRATGTTRSAVRNRRATVRRTAPATSRGRTTSAARNKGQRGVAKRSAKARGRGR